MVGVGRPKLVAAKSEVLQVRVTPALLARIDLVRGAASRADWARGVLSAAVGRTPVPYPEEPAASEAELVDHRHVRETVTPAVGTRPAVVRCRICHTPL